MALVTCELLWLLALLKDLQLPHHHEALVFCDSQVAIHIATNQIYHERTKYIEIDCHIVRDKIAQGMIRTLHVKSAHQVVDLLTKALHRPVFQALLSKMNVINIFHSPREGLSNTRLVSLLRD